MLPRFSFPVSASTRRTVISSQCLSNQGEKGEKGEPGQSVTSEVIPLGDTRCTNGVGGVQYTDSTGVRVVCNGQQGQQGSQGPPGTSSVPALYFTRRDNAEIPHGMSTAVATLTLPAGSYLISGVTTVRSFYPAGNSPDAVCQLTDGTAAQNILFNFNPPSNDSQVSYHYPFVLPSGGQVTLRCNQVVPINASTFTPLFPSAPVFMTRTFMTAQEVGAVITQP